jgi:hypothetical protein
VPEPTQVDAAVDYANLGYVANPFPPIDLSSTDPLWKRLVLRAASNGLLSAVLRASSSEHSRPFIVNLTKDVPDYYHRAAQNDFLNRTAHDRSLSMMTLNVPLEMMRLGRIRGTLAELAELVAAVDLPVTVGAYLVDTLKAPDADAGDAQDEAADELQEAVAAFADDPAAAMRRFFGSIESPAPAGPTLAEDDAMHEVYVRQVGLEVNPDEEREAVDGEEGHDAEALAASSEPTIAAEAPAEPAVHPDAAVRERLLAHVRAELSPVIARALEAYGAWGESIVPQELKVTKAPRKTLAAILRLMSHRWKHVVVLFDRMDAWMMMEQETKMEVLAAFTELRWIIGEHGVMGVAVVKGKMIELEEHFAAGEQVDWSMPELPALYAKDFTYDAQLVQRWLDAASVTGTSAIRADGPELAPLVEACENDIQRFALMAEAALRDAAGRGASVLDAEAVVAGLDSVRIGDDES